MDFGTGPSLGGEGRLDQWWRCETKNEVCSCQIVEITGKIYVKHLDWRRVGAAPLSATFMLTLQLLPHSLQSRHIFSPRSLHFSIQFTPLRPLNSFVCPSPAVLLPSDSHLLPFIPSLETSPLQGKTSAAHFVSLVVPSILPSLHFSSLFLLFRSLSPYNRLLEPLKIHISTSFLLSGWHLFHKMEGFNYSLTSVRGCPMSSC